MNNEVTYHLEPGYVYVSGEGDVIRTVLGSTAAVCLYDARLSIGGVCSYIHAGRGDKSTHFAEIAISELLRLLQSMGSLTHDLVAHIYGGGYREESTKKAAYQRIRSGRRLLERMRIPIISEDVGGSMGRKILFDTQTGQVAILKVYQTRQEDWF